MEEAGIDHAQVSLRTVTRYFNSKGYFYLQARKKGLNYMYVCRGSQEKGEVCKTHAAKLLS